MRVRFTMVPSVGGSTRLRRPAGRRGGSSDGTPRVPPMGSFRVVSQGPFENPLDGTVHVGGAKNSALKLMAAALLAPGRSVVRNVPDILDIAVMGDLLRRLGG